MRSTFTRKQSALACAVALGVFQSIASAQGINEHGLVTSPGGQAVMSGFGLCVRSRFGPAPAWSEECHGARPAPVAQYVAPAAAPAPAPIAAAGSAAAVYEKVVFDANVLFDSNKSELRPAGRNALERVNAVKAYLIAKGVGAERVATSARGETQPSTSAAECREANTRDIRNTARAIEAGCDCQRPAQAGLFLLRTRAGAGRW